MKAEKFAVAVGGVGFYGAFQMPEVFGVIKNQALFAGPHQRGRGCSCTGAVLL